MTRLLLLTLIASLTYLSCNSSPNQKRSTADSDGVVDADTFEKLTTEYDQIIDVRTPREYASGYIPNAINIDYYSDDFEKRIIELDAEKPVLLYCKVGGRSGKTYRLLKSKGFKKVYDLEDGIIAWKAAGKAIEK